MRRGWEWLIVFAFAVGAAHADDSELGEHGTLDANGVKLHYVTAGKGPLLVMIHGFPDYWYTWRHQMPVLAKHFQVVAYDQRGYNKSDHPEGVDNYKMEKLVADLTAVIDHFKQKKAVVVGHDWGAMVAWTMAMTKPERVDRLVILNLPHPKGLMRELANNPKQRLASAYARAFQQPEAAKQLTPEALTFWVKGEQAKRKYTEALRRSSMEGMLNYYKANYPQDKDAKSPPDFPNVKCPVLMFHGLKDVALLPGALDGTWNWIDNELTLITLPKAGHFVQHDAKEQVTRHMVRWLTQE